MSDTQAVETFPAMLRRVLGDRLASEAGTFPEMFAPDGVFEYPFAPPGLGPVFSGRDAIVANFERIRTFLRIDSVFEVSEIGTSDPDVIVLEFRGRGEGLLTKEAYRQRYISVIRVRDGRIVRYQDYWNPLEILRAAKGSDTVDALTID